jgi:hypothetical protein
MEEKAYAATESIGKLANTTKSSSLANLLEAQERTGELLRVLGEKLGPISSPVPTDGQKRVDSGYHIQTAVSKQHEINDAVSYLIDTLVV